MISLSANYIMFWLKIITVKVLFLDYTGLHLVHAIEITWLLFAYLRHSDKNI